MRSRIDLLFLSRHRLRLNSDNRESRFEPDALRPIAAFVLIVEFRQLDVPKAKYVQIHNLHFTVADDLENKEVRSLLKSFIG